MAGVQPEGVRGFKLVSSEDGLRHFQLDVKTFEGQSAAELLQGFRNTRVGGALRIEGARLPKPREGYIWLVDMGDVKEVPKDF